MQLEMYPLANGFQQILTAASEGIIAIKSIFDDIERSKGKLWTKK